MGPDIRVFLSYARIDARLAGQLAADLEWLVDEVWLDNHIAGGQQWWDTILDQIAACTLFVLAVSPASIGSQWCTTETAWARALARPILPIGIEGDLDPGLMPRWLRDLQLLTVVERTTDSLLPVAKAVRLLTRDPAPLPTVPPTRPAKPAMPLDAEREELGRSELSPTEQQRVLISLQASVSDPRHRAEAVRLLQILADRQDVTRAVHEQSVAAVAQATTARPDRTRPVLARREAPMVSLIQGSTVSVLRHHTDETTQCAVDPAGRYIVSASNDKTLRLWDPATGATIRTLEGHGAPVVGCAVAPDGTFIVSSSRDRTLRLWDPATGATIRTLEGHSAPVVGCAVAPDGTFIVSASDDHTLRLWDPATGATTGLLEGHDAPVVGCAVAPDGTYVVSASEDHSLRLWDPATGATIRTLRGHTSCVNGCTVAPDGAYVASASMDNTLRLWNPSTGTTTLSLRGHTQAVWGCAVAPDGSYIVSASIDDTLRLWNPSTGDTTRILEGHTASVLGCAVAPDGAYIVSTSEDRTVRIWR